MSSSANETYTMKWAKILNQLCKNGELEAIRSILEANSSLANAQDEVTN
jgi:hypothetical protein